MANHHDHVSDANALRKAMKGFGTDEDAIVAVLNRYANEPRECAQLRKTYADHIGRDLIKDFEDELRGNLELVCVLHVLNTEERLAWVLHKAMKGMGTNETMLVEVLCTNNDEMLGKVAATYKRMYDRHLTDDITAETSGMLRTLFTNLITLRRGEPRGVGGEESAMVQEHATRLYNAGEAKFGTNEGVFAEIFSMYTKAHLTRVRTAYLKKYGKTLEQVIKDEFRGDKERALVTMLEHPKHVLAKNAHKSDEGLIRVVLVHSHQPKRNSAYIAKYEESLVARIKNKLGGDSAHLLVPWVDQDDIDE